MPKRLRFVLSLSLLAGAALPALAAPNTPAINAAAGLHWRLVGPFRGGWATMAAGIADQPNTFYFGAADGGVWKTTNAGRTWQPLMQHQGAATVGAIAIARSNPKVIYVGTGQVAARYDIAGGDGVYKSTDGGKAWTNVGLDKTRHIGRIIIDPKNPDHVLVAALGHIFNANPQRGVYLTTDGGKTWKKTLFINAKTGAVDLASDPAHPNVVYAAAWQMRMRPWLDYFQPQAGPGSGIYKSTDGCLHWHKLTGHGLPGGELGRIGLAVKGSTVYATIVAASGQIGADNMMTGGGSGLYRSDDGGAHWHLVNTDPELASSYFSRVTVDPVDADTVYVIGRSIHKSTDGGTHFTIIKGSPGGDDYHFLWINPKHPDHMITAADQGCVVTVDGGKSWSSWYNQPTGQFYHVATDNQFPYRIYGGQQDSGTVSIASRGPSGVIGTRQWHPVGGDERDFDVPKPGDPNLVFGSGLGGYVSRWNAATHEVTDVSPWPVSSYGADPRKVKYRYTWISPIAFGSGKAQPLYFGAQVLFRSTDDGANWQLASGDLSGSNPHAKDCSQAQNSLAAAKSCGFGVIFTIAPSKQDPNTIWVGTDDGVVQLTTDGGKHWRNVTPKAMPLWARVDAISTSPLHPDTTYVAVDTHRLGAFHPLLFRTTDGGKHWNKIIAGLPADQYTTSIVADPKQAGLVYAATNHGVYVSFDAGKAWHTLGQGLPTTSVRDITVRDNDLVAATMGRGFWSLDDVTPLRAAAATTSSNAAQLYKPAVAIRLRNSTNRDTPPPPSEPKADNPPTGAIIDYWLKQPANGPVTLAIKDSSGQVVRRFSSAAKPAQLKADRYFQPGWVGAHAPQPAAGAGFHRFVWDLRGPRPPAITYHYSISAVWPGDTPLVPQGELVLPGKYTVTLAANGKQYSAPLTVRMDPRAKTTKQALEANLAMHSDIAAELKKAIAAYDASGDYIKQLKQRGGQAKQVKTIESWRDKGSNSLRAVSGVLDTLATKLEFADAAPTQGQRKVYADYKKQLTSLLARWQSLKGS
ncbi:MAG: VPS10 domain-containing protein [Gammaproteobacteria bacterium]